MAKSENLDLILKKLQARDEENITLNELEFALSQSERRIKILLVNYLEDCDDENQISFLVKRLPKIFPEESDLNLYKSFLTYSDERIVSNTIEGLAEIESLDTTSLFTQLLLHSSHRVRSVAAKSLANQDPAKVQKIIKKLLDSKDLNLIKSGCHAITCIENDNFINLLIPLTQKPETQMVAFETLGKMALKHLETFFNKPELTNKPELKEPIIKALTKILGNKKE